VVLGVDDAHLLDPVLAALVLHLAGTANMFVLATVRAGEPCPDAIVSLWKDAGARRIELARLDNEAVSRLVEAALQGPLEQAALQWVVDRSQGNPLYLRELVLGGLEDQTLGLNRGLWRLAGRPTVSPTLVELIERRMSALSAAQRAPIELLALGEPLRVQEIAGVTEYESVADAEAARRSRPTWWLTPRGQRPWPVIPSSAPGWPTWLWLTAPACRPRCRWRARTRRASVTKTPKRCWPRPRKRRLTANWPSTTCSSGCPACFWGVKCNQETRDLLTRAEAWSTEPSRAGSSGWLRFASVSLR
jgi:hypothetical protein